MYVCWKLRCVRLSECSCLLAYFVSIRVRRRQHLDPRQLIGGLRRRMLLFRNTFLRCFRSAWWGRIRRHQRPVFVALPTRQHPALTLNTSSLCTDLVAEFLVHAQGRGTWQGRIRPSELGLGKTSLPRAGAGSGSVGGAMGGGRSGGVGGVGIGTSKVALAAREGRSDQHVRASLPPPLPARRLPQRLSLDEAGDSVKGGCRPFSTAGLVPREEAKAARSAVCMFACVHLRMCTCVHVWCACVHVCVV